MNINENSIKEMKICQYLIDSFGYNMLKIEGSDDRWLVNPDESKYNIIRITNMTSTQNNFNAEMIEKFRLAISSRLSGKKDYLEICISGENDGFLENENKSVWTLKEDVPSSLSHKFPQLPELIKIKDQNTELRNIQKKAIEARKKLIKIKQPKVTLVIIGICVAIFLFINIFNNLNSSIEITSIAIAFGAYYQNFIIGLGEYWRFLTSGFIHIGFVHLLMNMLSFYYMGVVLEKVLGWKKYLFVLTLSIIAGSLFVWATNGAVVAVGLSGGIFGLFGCLIIYFFKMDAFRNPALRGQIIGILFVNIFISMQPGVGWEAHLGGFIFGVLMGLIIFYKKERMIFINSLLAIIVLSGAFGIYGAYNARIDTPYLATDMQVVEVYRSIGLDGYADYLVGNIKAMYD